MKNFGFIPFIFSFLIAFVFQNVASAQFDDLYYDPDKDVYEEEYANNEYDEEYYDEDSYDDNTYEYWEEDPYHYTRRINRFYRPAYGFGYYDPFYTNVYYANPYAPIDPVYYYDYGSPNVYVSLNFGNPYRYYPYVGSYSSPWYPRSGFGISYSPWGYGSRYNPYSPFGGYGYNGNFGRYGGYGGYGIGSALYCPPGYYGVGNSIYNYGYRNTYVSNQTRVFTSRGYKSAETSSRSSINNRVSPRTSGKNPAFVNNQTNRSRAISSARSTRINSDDNKINRTRIYDSKQQANRISNRTTNSATRINNTRSSSNSRSSILSRPNTSSRSSTLINRNSNRTNSSSINRSSGQSNIKSSPSRTSGSSGATRTSSRSSGRSGNNN